MDNLLKASLGLWMTLVLVGAFLCFSTAGLRDFRDHLFPCARGVAAVLYGWRWSRNFLRQGSAV